VGHGVYICLWGAQQAPEPPRATRNQPEPMRNLSTKTLFFHFFEFRLSRSRLSPNVKNQSEPAQPISGQKRQKRIFGAISASRKKCRVEPVQPKL